ncbi:MAG: glucosamine-6-phosphate deaminase [Oscillospiraceae bacterium]|nr:glucosamine-6-phosphate deaminase [Oscillospiraceae bacterium]
MEVKIFDSTADLALYAARIFQNVIKENSAPVLGLATGASPVETYKELIKMYNNGEISFKDVTTFNLDEYCDLPKDDKNSYYTFMMENLFNYVDIDKNNVNIPDGNAADTDKYGEEYDKKIMNAGGIDIQLLGIGVNGHIGFNEPSESFSEGTHKVKLTDSTLKANSRYFTDSEMPHYALTMGIGSIMNAKKIVLIATGEAKAQAVYSAVKGEVSPNCPASILQTHNDAIFLLDSAAASML